MYILQAYRYFSFGGIVLLTIDRTIFTFDVYSRIQVFY